MKPQHWRGFPDIFGLEGPPMLGFLLFGLLRVQTSSEFM